MAPFEPYTEISLIGAATPAGWTLPSSAPMTKIDEYTYQWTGNLTTGEIKFTCDNQSDWMGAWFMAVEMVLRLKQVNMICIGLIKQIQIMVMEA